MPMRADSERLLHAMGERLLHAMLGARDSYLNITIV